MNTRRRDGPRGAAVRIQAAFRGWRTRRSVIWDVREELTTLVAAMQREIEVERLVLGLEPPQTLTWPEGPPRLQLPRFTDVVFGSSSLYPPAADILAPHASVGTEEEGLDQAQAMTHSFRDHDVGNNYQENEGLRGHRQYPPSAGAMGCNVPPPSSDVSELIDEGSAASADSVDDAHCDEASMDDQESRAVGSSPASDMESNAKAVSVSADSNAVLLRVEAEESSLHDDDQVAPSAQPSHAQRICVTSTAPDTDSGSNCADGVVSNGEAATLLTSTPRLQQPSPVVGECMSAPSSLTVEHILATHTEDEIRMELEWAKAALRQRLALLRKRQEQMTTTTAMAAHS